MVPAAVIISGNIFPNALAASNTVLYPARLLWELNASIFCALDILGMASMEKLVMPFFTQASTRSGLVAAHINEINTAEGFSNPISDEEGAFTFKITSDVEY